MTTSERIRRRQWVQGIVILLLAIFTALQAVAFNLESRDQQKCLEQSFSDLNQALSVRTQLVTESNRLREQNNRLTQDQFDWLLSILVTSASNQKATEEERAELRERFLREVKEFQQRRVEVERRFAEVVKEQAGSPLPAYPKGKCQ